MLKYISPGSWFSLEYPMGWHEFEDAEDSFLFYNPDKWSGNFRISAFRGEHEDYAAECVDYELSNTVGAVRVKVGDWDCAFSKEDFQEEGTDYTSYLWVTGKGAISVECSFTVLGLPPLAMLLLREVDEATPLRELVIPLLLRELVTPLRLPATLLRELDTPPRFAEIDEFPLEDELAIAAERLIGLECVEREALVADERLFEKLFPRYAAD